MGKLKLFLENFVVYGVGGIINKIIPLIMVPIITRLMPNTTYFGLSDLSNTVISFASAFAGMGMYDAMYRMFFEKSDKRFQKSVCSTALVFTVSTSVCVFIIMIIFRNFIAQFFLGDVRYSDLVYILASTTLIGATNQIIAAPTRMQNKKEIYIITNAVSSILSYAIAIPLLMLGHYVIALPLAALISVVCLEFFFWVINRKWFSIRLVDKKLLKSMLTIGIPLLPSVLIYWVFNSSDKIMITNMIGIGAAGIYSIGSKLGHCSQLIYTAFAGGWQYFSFSTMKDKNQVKSNSMVFEYLGIISFVATAFVCAWSSLIFRILFTDEYYDGYIIAPYLFLAPLLQMLFQVCASQFIIKKKTWPNMVILLGGAGLNIVLNLFLIPILGIEGAAIATLVGYVASDIICVIVLCKMDLMILSKKFILAAFLMITFIVIWRLVFSDNTIIGTLIALALMGVFILLYNEELKQFMSLIKRKGKN